MSNWDDVEGERGKKESLLSHSTQRPQEHRSWNTSGKSSLREVQRLKRPRFTPVQQLFDKAMEKRSKLRPTRLSSNSQEVSVPAVFVK